MQESLHVLVVDDDPQDRLSVARVLTDAFADVQIEPVADAERFGQALARGDFDLVIMERAVHWSDGLAVLRAVKERYPRCPVILFTAMNDDSFIAQALEAGLDDCVCKVPGRFDRLLPSVRWVLGDVLQGQLAPTAAADYRSLFECVPMGLYRAAPDGQILDANPALVTMLGYPDRATLVGVNIESLLVDAEARAQRRALLMDEGLVYRLEMRMRRYEGTVIWVEENTRAVRDREGNPLYCEGSLQDITRRRQTEEELAHERDLLRALMDNIPDAIYFKDTDSRFLRINRAQAHVLGVSDPEEAIGKTDFDFFTPEHAREAYADEQRIVASGQPVIDKQERIRRADGQYRWVSATKVPIWDQQGRVIGIVGISRDITDRKLAEEALRASEERFRAFFEGAAIGIALVDLEGHPVQVNPALQKMLGYSEEELRRMTFAEFTHPDDRALDLALFQELLEGKRDHYHMEKRYIRKDGQVIWGHLTVSSLRHENPTYVIGMVEDITERKRAEEALRESQERLQAIMDNAPAVIFVRDLQGRYLLVNRGYEERFRLAREDLVGKTPYDIFPKDVADALLAHDREVLEAGKPLQFEEVVPQDGEQRTYIAVKFPLRDHAGSPYGVCTIATDITERKQTEQALAEAKSHLQAVISNAPIVLWALDREGNFTLLEGKGLDALGAHPERAIGRSIFEVCRDLPSVLEYNRRALGGEESTGVVEVADRVLEARCSPLRNADGELIGVIGVATDVTERKQAEAEVRRRAAYLEALNSIIAAVAAASQLDELLEITLERTLQAFGISIGGIRILDKHVFRGIAEAERKAIARCVKDGRFSKAEPVVVEDWLAVQENPARGGDVATLAPAMVRLGIRSSLTVPILAEGQSIGRLCLASRAPHQWTAEEVALAEAVGRQLGTAAERLRLLEETRRRLQEVTLLSRIIALTASARDLPTALREVCTEMARFFDVPQAAFALLNPDRTAAEVIAEYLAPGRPSSLGDRIPVADNPSMRHLLERRRPLAITDAQNDPRLAPVRALLRRRGTVSLLLVPIEAGGEIIGTLGLDAIEPREWRRDDVRLAENVARQVGQMLERLRIFSDLQERVRLMDQLQPLSEALNRPLSVDEVVEAVGRGALALSGADRVAVYIRYQGDRIYCAWSHGLSERYIEQITAHVDRVPGGRLRTDPNPMLIPDMSQLPGQAYEWLRNLTRMEGYRGLALWPLVYEGRMVATIGCYYDAPRTWSKAEQEVMEAFARQAAIALENARLYESLQEMNEELQAAVQARDEMIQNVSHELRTPLALIKGYIELLGSDSLGTLNARQMEAVTVMQRQSERLLSMVNQLLTLQRLGAEMLQQAFTRLEMLLQEAVYSWRPRAKEAGIQLQLELPDSLPPLMVDPDLIGQVIANLLDNAVKFSPEGGTITIRAWAEGDEVLFSVADQGIGIPPDKLEQIFERFYQVEGNATRRFGGMGIGLALCRKIVELHGGRIWAESEGEGKGSTFYVALPVADIESEA